MKLVIFDVDGTLVDSQHHIHHAMSHAFQTAGLPVLPQSRVLEIVGLSLPVAIARLAPETDEPTQARIVQGYKDSFMSARKSAPAPLYPGARDCLDALATRDDLLLAVATGKSRRGLDAMIEAHGLQGRFMSLQTADNHPSKPHPAMLEAVLSETGMDAADAVMVGDTSFDIEMAVAAGIRGFGVAWGYHQPAALRDVGAELVAPDFPALTTAIMEWAA
ncbi:HAD-IA family hydrolase [Paracoccus saliphilus]|uniref:HAD-IA family hydrolase n=1 Tax=Paracoccus saliphilus TaxID=405559 RepID=A0AA45W5C5_9RHOB|nr:HAD-IA family hydrolase [Paracoccus saliphilus]WCR02264.1 HAD-IA family hydrolase [Paracoccus saliphilus]SIS92827.1 phosphoglycolate phosphatase [Paracoccus saliphilus]